MAFSKAINRSAGASAATPQRSRFAGVKAREERDPFLTPGDYRLKLTRVHSTQNPGTGAWRHFQVEVVDSTVPEFAAGAASDILFSLSPKAETTTAAKIKALGVALAGCADEAEYDAEDGDGFLLEALVTGQGPRAADVDAMIGTEFDCRVTRGRDKTDGSGDFYREYQFAKAE